MNDEILKLKSDLEVIKATFKDAICSAEIRIEHLVKKEGEVKPVFPSSPRGVGGGCICYARSRDADEAADLGLSEYGDEKNIEEWLKARKHVIEEINKANKGDNGYSVDNKNWLLSYDHKEAIFKVTWMSYTQSLNDYEYIRTKKAADELLKDDKFVDALKIMKGIE